MAEHCSNCDAAEAEAREYRSDASYWEGRAESAEEVNRELEDSRTEFLTFVDWLSTHYPTAYEEFTKSTQVANRMEIA
jgi:hypothetical protein